MNRSASLLAVAALLTAPALTAQVQVTGGVTAYGEAYHRSGAPPAARPDQTGRLNANLTFDFLHGLFVVPLTALIATDGVQFRQQINQVGLSPTYRSVTLHLGTFTPDFSRYTFADATLTGGGIDVRRPGFRAGVVAGRSQRAVRPDTTTLFPQGDPQFERHAAGARLGFGPIEGSYVDVDFFTAEDDRGSLDTSLTNNFPVSAMRNRVLALKGRLLLAGHRISLDGEAASATTRDNTAGSTPAVTRQAVTAKLLYNMPAWSLGGTVEYLAAGFRTLGNSGLSDDRIDYGVTGRAQLGARLQLSGMGGWRRDNLSDAFTATTSQAIYNLAASWQPGAAFGLDVQAANNVNNSRPVVDSLSIKNITGQYSFIPHLLWRTGRAQHLLVVATTFLRSDNTTPGTTALADTRTRNVVATWSVSFPSSLAFTGVYTETLVEVDSLRTKVYAIQPGLAYALFARKLQLAVQAQFTTTERPTGGRDSETYPIVQLRYAVARGQNLQLRSSVRHSETAFGSFDERVATLQYSASWR